ncbi:pentatricopeptide repeat-containing protein At4g08210 [Cucurbita moschata]|uniref:Pentatricopeptide repeat-containing protein At4g08210 n=1 Tax=Cucurbita moschata TaxID=3662 RepID=A0A6J1HN25_CUCMO|nr:pentatricopeptide repeat-containing protein At4g08210 [Cucurbita moschata]
MFTNCIAKELRHCAQVRAFRRGNSLHAYLRKFGCLNDVFIANNLISMYAEFSNLRDAEKVFDEMSDRNIVTWTTLVSAFTDSGRPYEALRVYDDMPKSETANGYMYSAVLKACGLVGDLDRGKLIQERIYGGKLQGDTILMNSLMDMYVKCGSLSDAVKVFHNISRATTTTWNIIISGYSKAGLMVEAEKLFHCMPQPNVVSWNSMIAGFADNGSQRALEFVSLMHRKGIKLDDFTFPCALKISALHGLLVIGKQIHSYVTKLGHGSSCFTLSALIDMYSNCNGLTEAVKLFDQHSSFNPSISENLALWNSMLSGYVINNCDQAALNLISYIHCSGTILDSYTFGGALKVCINLLNPRVGFQVHGLIVTCGYELDYVVGSIVVDLYAKLGRIDDALALFHRLPRKDIIAWSGLILGCAQMGLNWLAFSVFKDMLELAHEIDHFVISTTLKVCSNLASLRSGKQVHAFCVKSGYEMEGFTITSLLDMYSKCGEIEDALTLFDCIQEKDIVTWTGIIVGCGQNGRAAEAVRFFHEMIQSGLNPNEITFLGVLSACRYAGLIEEARNIFNSMKSVYGLEPHLEHYCCMVDLLALAGLPEEAEKLIANMPFEPDQTTWRTLLGACGTRNDTKLINSVANGLLEATPDDPSTYVSLSNAYASLGMWHNLSKAREAAKKVGVKRAGLSWIEVAS